jgi:hypothetical protein
MEAVQTSAGLYGVTSQKIVFFIIVVSVFSLKPEMDYTRVPLIATPFGFQRLGNLSNSLCVCLHSGRNAENMKSVPHAGE